MPHPKTPLIMHTRSHCSYHVQSGYNYTNDPLSVIKCIIYFKSLIFKSTCFNGFQFSFEILNRLLCSVRYPIFLVQYKILSLSQVLMVDYLLLIYLMQNILSPPSFIELGHYETRHLTHSPPWYQQPPELVYLKIWRQI